MLLHVIRYLRLKQTDFLLRIGTNKNHVTPADVNFTTAMLRCECSDWEPLPDSVRDGFANLVIMPGTFSPTDSWKENVCIICIYS